MILGPLYRCSTRLAYAHVKFCLPFAKMAFICQKGRAAFDIHMPEGACCF
jgi:hypothetical protein